MRPQGPAGRAGAARRPPAHGSWPPPPSPGRDGSRPKMRKMPDGLRRPIVEPASRCGSRRRRGGSYRWRRRLVARKAANWSMPARATRRKTCSSAAAQAAAGAFSSPLRRTTRCCVGVVDVQRPRDRSRIRRSDARATGAAVDVDAGGKVSAQPVIGFARRAHRDLVLGGFVLEDRHESRDDGGGRCHRSIRRQSSSRAVSARFASCRCCRRPRTARPSTSTATLPKQRRLPGSFAVRSEGPSPSASTSPPARRSRGATCARAACPMEWNTCFGGRVQPRQCARDANLPALWH